MADQPVIIQYIVDTRKLWPHAEKTAQLETEASRALALLNEDERKGVLRYMFVRDAKMSLASHILKHYAVAKLLSLPWSATKITRNSKTKPIYTDPATGTCPIDFNVSHQAGLVALVAATGAVDVGCDVVCVSEREARDQQVIETEGWPEYVDMHADVFAPGEAAYLKYQILSAIPGALPPASSARDKNAFKLRCFYTLWCLREAYIKMTGDALLAPWLKVLEFKNFKPPHPQAQMGEARPDGEDAVRVADVWFEGSKVEDANVSLRSLGPDYMTCTALRTPEQKEAGLGVELGPYEVVELDEILAWAEARL
ncbi:unnamed protein product [Discula destructiva]